MDAFDADVLIYAAEAEHPLGRRVRPLILESGRGSGQPPAAVGSLLLVPEVLTKPTRDGATDEAVVLRSLLGRLDLLPVDRLVALLAVTLGGRYRLRTIDAIHLATAVAAGADRLITNNRRDYKRSVVEVEVVYPDDLPTPS